MITRVSPDLLPCERSDITEVLTVRGQRRWTLDIDGDRVMAWGR